MTGRDHDHVTRVMRTVSCDASAARSRLAASWQRSFAHHRLDPAAATPQDRDTRRLAEQEEMLGRLLHVASPRLDELFSTIGQSGHGVFMTDARGLILRARQRAADEADFIRSGLVAGGDWSEEAQGTNGIGTCLTEKRPLIIHRDQHYLARNIAMSCIDAPVFDHEGTLIAALDVSSPRAESDGFNQLIGAMVSGIASKIEIDLFRDIHSDRQIVLVGDDRAGTALLAVDRDGLVVGATRSARIGCGLARQGALRPVPLRDVLGETSEGLSGAEKAALTRALARANGNVSAAARALGIGRATLYRRMKRLGISGAD